MLKKLPFLVAAFFTFTAFGQTIVSTSPENRNVVLEEFTGIYCVYCPDGHAIAQAIQDANPDRVSLINIHTGSFASPGGNDPDYRTPYGSAIAGQSRLTGYPAGTVNRHVFQGRGMQNGGTAMSRGDWTRSASEILDMPSYVNVAVEAEIDMDTKVMEIHVEAYYTGDSPEPTNLLNIAILQDNTKGPQTGGNQGNNYNHMHRLIDMVTGQWGEEITQTTEGTFIDRTFTYQVADDHNGIPIDIKELEIVAFITETHQEILTGSRAYPYYNGMEIQNDAGIVALDNGIAQDACFGEEITFNPKVIVENFGAEPITSMEINYVVKGEPYVANWTGYIHTFKTGVVTLPEVTTTVGYSNNISVTLPDDENNTNNSISETFGAINATGYVDLTVHAGQNSDQLRWRIRTSQGAVVYSGGPYQPGEVQEERFQMEEGCYEFLVIDSQGRNDGSISLVDHHGTEIYSVTGSLGSINVSTAFYSSGFLNTETFDVEKIAIYPNPANDILNVTNADGADFQIYDVLGKVVLSRTGISNNEGIGVSQLPSGVYFMKISKDGKLTTKKFIISR